jgi:hypothetical protein
MPLLCGLDLGLPRRARGPRPRPVCSAGGERGRTGGYSGVRPSTNAGAPRGGPDSEGGLGARNALGRRGASVGAWPGRRGRRNSGAARGGTASVGLISCHSSPVRALKTPEIWIEVHQVVNRKVVDLTTLHDFYKGSREFFSTDFAQSAAKLWMSLCSGKQEQLAVGRIFHQFPLKIWNANLHESCVPRQTGQLS